MQKRYNILEPFEYNKEQGPFEEISDKNEEINELLSDCGIEADIFGFKTKLPLGVAAGPLYNKDYMRGASKDGFSVITWKTFRTSPRLAHRNEGDFLGHNIVYIQPQLFTFEMLDKKLVGALEFSHEKEKVSITNSFGMPSSSPLQWMKEIEEIEKYMDSHNKLAISSVVGTPKEGGGVEELAEDFALAARLAEMSGAKIVELNLSCPNVKGKEGSIFKNPKDARIIVEKTRKFLDKKETKLLIKVGYCEEEEYRELLNELKELIDGVVAINTIPMEVVDEKGEQALPGGAKSGICGYAIIDMAVEAVARLVKVRNEIAPQVRIFGCGGVTNPEAFMRHIEAGAECVFVGTAALFNPELPLQCAKYLKEHSIRKTIK